MSHVLRVIALTLVCWSSSGAVLAQATRTWVSGVGDDANPCSRTAPCKTFAGAISKTATGGVISVLDPGGYGSVTITKPITIDGGGTEGAILAAASSGIIVSAASGDKVHLRNLSINAPGNGLTGVRILSNSDVTVERVVISGMTTGIEQSGTAATAQLNVYDSTINGSATYGMLINAGRATVDNVRFSDNAVDGLRVVNGSVTVRRSVATGHPNIGFSATGGILAISDSLTTNNVYGIASYTGATVIVGNTSVINNGVRGLVGDGSSLLSFGNNAFGGNAVDGTFTGSVALQ
jgi:Right handed beta helix region